MPALKNQRPELFAQELVAGKPYTRAYTAAGYKKDDSHAARLARNGLISARVAELRNAIVGTGADGGGAASFAIKPRAIFSVGLGTLSLSPGGSIPSTGV